MRKLMKKGLVLGMTAIMAVSVTGCSPIKTIHNVSSAIAQFTAPRSNSGTYDYDEKMKLLEGYIDDYYYFDKDEKLIEESVYAGLVAGLDDPYSCYYTEEEYKQMQEDTSGEYVGIGVQVLQSAETGEITATKIFKDSPAEKAGIMKGDIFYKIDDFELTPTTDINDAVSKIRGEAGTSVTVTMYRPSEKKTIDFDMIRAAVTNSTVAYEMLDNQIGYVEVTQFDEVTGDEYIKACDALKAQGMKGLIVDLRDNGGGLLTTVRQMCDYMLPAGSMIVYTKTKDGEIDSEYKAITDESFDLPLVVLVNGNSASASEIFTGAMKDHGVGKIVGTTTFGKGIVQSVFPLGDGTAIKLTVEKYFTPDGNDIHKIGIEPDVKVELNEGLETMSDIPHEDDNQLQTAIDTVEEMMK